MEKTQTAQQSVLLVEDDAPLRSTLSEELRKIVPLVYTAENGEEGIGLFRAHRPTVVVSDYRMPKLDGLEFLKAIGEDGSNTPVIWTTGHSTPQLEKLAWGAGVFEILEKPFPTSTLRDCVHLALEWAANPSRPRMLARRICTRELVLAIDLENFTRLEKLCQERELSMTSFINKLVVDELRRSEGT